MKKLFASRKDAVAHLIGLLAGIVLCLATRGAMLILDTVSSWIRHGLISLFDITPTNHMLYNRVLSEDTISTTLFTALAFVALLVYTSIFPACGTPYLTRDQANEHDHNTPKKAESSKD